MKVNWKKSEKNMKKIDDVKVGECFTFNKWLCMKVNTQNYDDYFLKKSSYPNIVIDLENGCLFSIDKTEKVKMVEVSTTVTYD